MAVAVLVFAVVFAVYAWSASPALGWLDSPEFVAQAASLGVAHSPGHPTPAVVGKLATLVPVGDVAFRVNLMSALCAAGAASAVVHAARTVIGRVAPAFSARQASALAGGAALVFALSWAAWFQAVRAEVYALQSLLCAVVIACVVRFDHPERTAPRWILLGALAAGLALSNHHFIALICVVPAAVACLARRARPRPGTLGACAALGILGLSAFLYLPIRSAAGPEVNWGAPHTAERFAWTVTARAFHKSARTGTRPNADGTTSDVGAALIADATPPLAALALVAVFLGLRRPGWRRSAGFLAAVVALGTVGRAVIGFDPDTPDHHGYLLPSLCALVVLAAAGTAALTQLVITRRPSLGRVGPAIAAACVILVAPAQLVQNGPRAAVADAHASDDMARWELSSVPPDAVALVAYFQTSFRLWALRAVEHARPDIAILDRSFLTFPGTAEDTRRRYPELAPIIDAPLRADRPTPVAALAELARARPVVVQLHINLGPEANPHLVPAGAFAQLLPAPATEAQRVDAEATDTDERATLTTRVVDAAADAEAHDAALAALWHDVTRLRFYCATRRRDAALRALADAWRLSPEDPGLLELARACGLEVPR